MLKEIEDKRVCILGLGYVGLTLAVTLADIGFEVYGIEIRDEVCSKIKIGKPHFFEPGLEENLKRLIKNKRLKITKNIPKSIKASVYIITVGTPLDKLGNTRLDMIEKVSLEVSQFLNKNDLVIMRSTVKLGTTRSVVMPLLEKANKAFQLAFCPERTLEGNALTELRKIPQIVGGITLSASIRASHLFQFVTPTVIRVSNIETAEMIKLIDNAQRDVNFAYANEVARACDALGVSAIEVIESGKLGYPRTNIKLPGLVGGPCLEKDSHILLESFQNSSINLEITKSARNINERQPIEIINYIKRFSKSLPNFSETPKIVLLGIAFKGQPFTDDIRGSMAIKVFKALKSVYKNASYFGFDYVVKDKEIKRLGLKVSKSLIEAFKDASLVIIVNNHPHFGSIPMHELSVKMKKPGIIYDFWNFFNSKQLHLSNKIFYTALGSHYLSKV